MLEQHYSSQLHNCNLLSYITSSLPDFICDIPEVFYINNLGLKTKMGLPLLLANMRAINKTWRLARAIGVASVYYCPVEKKLEIKPLLNNQKSLYGQVTTGLINSSLKDTSQFKIAYVSGDVEHRLETMYGIKHLYYNWGSTILTPKLSELVCNYSSTIHSLSQRVASSFGEMWILGGIDTNDAPLLGQVQDKMEEDIVNSRRGILPEGSDLKAFSASLGDFENILTPFERGISTESGVPSWLLFPTITSSSFDLESRTIWAKNTFNREVLPVLVNLLYAQGYSVVEINPPSYRDSLYDASVLVQKADSIYKDSSTAINTQMLDLNLQQLEMAKEQHDLSIKAGDGTVKDERVKAPTVEVKKRSQGRKL
jgi:hypothetical protein